MDEDVRTVLHKHAFLSAYKGRLRSRCDFTRAPVAFLSGTRWGRLGRIPSRGSGVLEPALQNGVFDDVDPSTQPQLAHGIGFVGFDGLDAQRQPAGDLLVAVARGDEPQDLRLALAERHG